MSDRPATGSRSRAERSPVPSSDVSPSRRMPVIATLYGIPAAVIVFAAANGASAPLAGDGAAALVALWILGSAMCALGISAMRERFGFAPTSLLDMPLGLLATALVLSGLFGWPRLLRPIVDTLGGPGPALLMRTAIVGVGAVMAVKWTIAWLSCLPRRTAPAS